jgi:hypothetical protein
MDDNLGVGNDPENNKPPDDQPCDDDGQGVSYEILPPLLLKPEVAAVLLAVSRDTLGELVRRDRLRVVEFIASGFRRPLRRYRLDDLRTFVEESTK